LLGRISKDGFPPRKLAQLARDVARYIQSFILPLLYFCRFNAVITKIIITFAEDNYKTELLHGKELWILKMIKY
jgi:hypothetical protein